MCFGLGLQTSNVPLNIGTDHQLYMTRPDLTIGVLNAQGGPDPHTLTEAPSSLLDINLGREAEGFLKTSHLPPTHGFPSIRS